MAIQVRALVRADLDVLNHELPSWSSEQYPRRLEAQDRGEMVQVFAWDGAEPVGRGMVLFAEHEEYSASAVREGCAEVRDVFVAPSHRRRGAARVIMTALEEASRRTEWARIGLDVSLGEEDAPARALYDALGYRHAHGPFVSSATLDADDGPLHVHGVLDYLIKDV